MAELASQISGPFRADSKPKVIFVFTGQEASGMQWGVS